jgi:cyclopropane fatty-acyl-phospholipid synthase-like methyltransferase
VTSLRAKWTAYLDAQHRNPSGGVGRLVGERMGYQHAPETRWSLSLLALRPGDRVLDLGCGAGHGISLLHHRQPDQPVVGVDLSETMLRSAARRNRGALARRRLSLLRADIGSLPFRPASFERIVSIHTFYFWPNPRELVERLTTLLAPAGRMVAIFATARTEATGVRVYWPLHERAQALVGELERAPGVHATFVTGPDSRQYNNVAIVLDKE